MSRILIEETLVSLYRSARGHHFEVVNLLLSAGANPNALDSEGNTSLHYSSRASYPEIVNLFLENSASKAIENKNGEILLEVAINNDKLSVLNLLK